MEINLSKCVGCGACAMACKLGNNTPNRNKSTGGTMNWADIAVQINGTAAALSTTWLAVPTLCNHCVDPKCVDVCPVAADANGRKAIFKDTDTGIVMHDNSRCIHCYRCRDNCPYSASPAALLSGDAQYSVVSVNSSTPHANWNSTIQVRDALGTWAGCTTTPKGVSDAAVAAPPYRTKWSHTETVAGISYDLNNIRATSKPEKCYLCYHRLKDTSLNGTPWVDGSGSEDTTAENTGLRKPYCVLACPAKARRLTTDAIPGGAKVLEHGSPYYDNLNLVDAAGYAPAYSTPQTYYIGQFSYRV